MALGLGVTIGLFIIFLAVLIGPFKIRAIEHNLEVFLFICGVLAMTISGFVELAGTETGWRLEIIDRSIDCAAEDWRGIRYSNRYSADSAGCRIDHIQMECSYP